MVMRVSQARALGLSPRAAQGRWPFRDHRTLAQVWAEEQDRSKQLGLTEPGGASGVAEPDRAAAAGRLPKDVPERVAHIATLGEIRARVDAALAERKEAPAPAAAPAAASAALGGLVAGVQIEHRIARIRRSAARQGEVAPAAAPAAVPEGLAGNSVPAVASVVGRCAENPAPRVKRAAPPPAAPVPLPGSGRIESDDADFVAELAARLAAKCAARVEISALTKGPPDYRRTAAAWAARVEISALTKGPPDYRRTAAAWAARGLAAAAPAPAPARPLEAALSREECPRCGIPGWKGCSHQLPYAGDPGARLRPD